MLKPGMIVVMDEQDTLGDWWIGIVLYATDEIVHAVRAWRGRPDERRFGVECVTESYPSSSRDMVRTATEIAACRLPKNQALDRAMLAARINALAEARREEELAMQRERNGDLADAFNIALAKRQQKLLDQHPLEGI